MPVTLTPQPKILTIWRSVLVFATAAPAFLCSLFFRPGTALWWGLSTFWVLLFLFFYLFYLPVRQRNLSLQIGDDRFVRTSGVFYNASRTVPFENIQFLRVQTSILHRRFGLATLIIVAPGGGMTVPGLRAEEAKRLVSVFFSEQQ